ncbi:MAG TPA: ABC transporter substrate-binding protein [Candidatus Deferrimicrobiaceae bacterium]|nr:ABC transporter substrate-binding protein [Candidatus Deferrimicrobiaceae bacterium]
MNPALAIALVVLGTTLLGTVAGTAQMPRPVRIGALTESWGPTKSIVGFRDGLQELGYRENEHFVLGVRFTQGETAALPAAARELLQEGVDLLLTAGPDATRAALKATDRIPIVFVGSSDPVGLGLVQSFARPGGNVTGVTDLDTELTPKRLELFKDIIPSLRKVLLPYDVEDRQTVAQLPAYRAAARGLGVALVERPVRTQAEAQATIGSVRKGEVDGILAPRYLALNIPGFMLEATARRAVPTMFHDTFFVEQGGLASYSASRYESGRQAARLADKILKGVKPSDLPVERPTKLELAINLRTARALGLTISRSVLLRADQVIE